MTIRSDRQAVVASDRRKTQNTTMLPRIFGCGKVPTESTRQDTSKRKQNHVQTNPQQLAETEKAVDSRLLALPVELRRQIYEYAVGGNWLHVGTEGRSVRPCVNPRRFRLRRDVIKSSPTRQRFTHALASHDECFTACVEQETSTRLCLALLQVCRQVYFEARLVPFSANTFVFKQRFVLERFFLVQGWERGLALRSVIFMHLLDNDYGLHHLMPNVKHVLFFVLLYRRAERGTRERSYIRTFTDYRNDIHSLVSAEVCLEFCGGYDTEGLNWLNDWDFRMAESNIEGLLIKGHPLSARTLSLLES
jgi:hypothetical protein